jgi:pimeloyl-ACP methyl ester carboxylesterase
VIERVELGPCPGYVYGGDGPTAVAMPGAMLAGMPALYYAFEPLLDAGWRIVLAWCERVTDRQSEPWEWIAVRTQAAIDYAGGADLIVAKSVGTLAAPFDVPAVWLTPLLNEDEVVAALRARTQPSLFVGGTDDPMWNGAVARELGEAVEIEGADHGLARIEDAPRVAKAVAAFSAGLGHGRA